MWLGSVPARGEAVPRRPAKKRPGREQLGSEAVDGDAVDYLDEGEDHHQVEGAGQQGERDGGDRGCELNEKRVGGEAPRCGGERGEAGAGSDGEHQAGEFHEGTRRDGAEFRSAGLFDAVDVVGRHRGVGTLAAIGSAVGGSCPRRGQW